uniref:Uncharacterized protein n=1 Tax=Anguilla anguilla TaxID=7936 RepID=A0A0E9QYE2_ANGAN
MPRMVNATPFCVLLAVVFFPLPNLERPIVFTDRPQIGRARSCAHSPLTRATSNRHFL